MEVADEKNKKKIYIILGIVFALILIIGAIFLFKGRRGDIKNLLTVQNKPEKHEFPNDPIEILEYAENLARESRYHLASNITRAVTGQEKQTIQEIYKTDGANNARADFLKDGLLYARMFMNKDGVWHCDYITSKNAEKPDCYKYGERSASSLLPKSFNPDVLRKWRDAGFIVFETKKETRRAGEINRDCALVSYELKPGAFSSDLIQPLLFKYNIAVSDSDMKEFSKNISGLALRSEQCFDYEIGAPIYSRSVIKYKDYSVEDTREAIGLLLGDKAVDKITLTKPAKSPKERSNYFYDIYPYKGVFYTKTYDDKLAVIKNGEVKIIEEVFRPTNIIVYNDMPIVSTAFNGVWKYENGKWGIMESAKDIGYVSAFINFQNGLHTVTSKGIYKFSGGKWDELFLFGDKVGEMPSNVLAVKDTIYFLTSFNGLFSYRDGVLEKIAPKENIDFGSKFLALNDNIYIKSGYSLSRIQNNSVHKISAINEQGEVVSVFEYNGKLYFSTYKGVYQETPEEGVKMIAKSDKVGEINDFVIYNNNLYIGGEKGVYYMSDNGDFLPLGDPEIFTEVNDLYVFNGALYAADTLILARWQGAEWETIDRDNVERFFENEGSLYAETEAGNLIEKVGSEQDNTLFDIPKEYERQIINN